MTFVEAGIIKLKEITFVDVRLTVGRCNMPIAKNNCYFELLYALCERDTKDQGTCYPFETRK